MTDHMEPSFWGMAYCCLATLLVAAFVTAAVGVDPMTLAMN
jgi:hypothetical protein